ncbi:AraC family transcriptional regulator [Paenibacillus sp. GCM10023252]|uniref:AraC family transcriptional regulator n=1 Tax=Paenibacillus sp. GCM10023252 TaxID=3252649 RepID=UPI00361C5D60
MPSRLAADQESIRPSYTAEIGVSVSMVYPILRTLVDKGLDKDAWIEKAGFDVALLRDTEAKVEDEHYERLTDLAAAMVSDELFGLHQGQSVEVADLGIVGYVMLHSGTIGGALAAYQRYNALVCNNYNIHWEPDGDDVVLTITYHHPHRPPARHCVEDMTSSLYHLMVRLACRPIALQGVRFTHALPSLAGEQAYADVLGVVPEFEAAESSFRIRREVLDYPVLFSDAKLLATFEAMAEEARRRLVQGRQFSDELHQWLLKQLPKALPSLKEAARAQHMSVRTLQVRLQQEQTTYQELLNQVRKELAFSYLVQPDYKIGEVAYLLHFSEPSAFQSAFKKWTGVTPRQYRQESIR